MDALIALALLLFAVGGVLAKITSFWRESPPTNILENIVPILMFSLLALLWIVCLAFVIGIIGVFLAQNEKITLGLYRFYLGEHLSGFFAQIMSSVLAAGLISVSIYIGTVGGIVFMQGVITNSIFMHPSLWATAFAEANPRFIPFLSHVSVALLSVALIRSLEVESTIGKMLKQIFGFAIMVCVFCFGFSDSASRANGF